MSKYDFALILRFLIDLGIGYLLGMAILLFYGEILNLKIKRETRKGDRKND